MIDRVLRIGTRGSKLALIQAEEVRSRLVAAGHPADAVAVVVISTTGDEIQDRTLAEIGGKGLFTKEIDEALLDGRIDLAVHSMKDLPTVLPAGTVIAAVLPREDPRDALIAGSARDLSALPRGAVVGTASLRRASQILMHRPDVMVRPLRGNVDTRLAKIARGEADATLLAVAGLKRLGLMDRASAILEPDVMLPAVAQGAIGVAARDRDEPAIALLRALDDGDSRVTVTAERSFLAVLDGSCRTPIAALARLEGSRLTLRGLIVTPDGRTAHAGERNGERGAAAAIGRELGAALRAAAGADFFAAL
ncbi:MAG: hydroxymethylbilane synthase [Alphaproteobacteria bacterium]|nr:hydroxymethylbilane synthase [Alphaproteobacteria bacterium]